MTKYEQRLVAKDLVRQALMGPSSGVLGVLLKVQDPKDPFEVVLEELHSRDDDALGKAVFAELAEATCRESAMARLKRRGRRPARLADDAWQLTSTAVAFGWRGFWGNLDAFRRWVGTIHYCQTGMLLRGDTRYRRRVGHVHDDSANLLPSREAGPAELVEADEMRIRLREALSKLADVHRQVFDLRMFKDLPWADISLALGISLYEAKATYSRAVAQLKRLLPTER
jgi:RNA polymerase sigma factor (sigma-70 family)